MDVLRRGAVRGDELMDPLHAPRSRIAGAEAYLICRVEVAFIGSVRRWRRGLLLQILSASREIGRVFLAPVYFVVFLTSKSHAAVAIALVRRNRRAAVLPADPAVERVLAGLSAVLSRRLHEPGETRAVADVGLVLLGRARTYPGGAGCCCPAASRSNGELFTG